METFGENLDEKTFQQMRQQQMKCYYNAVLKPDKVRKWVTAVPRLACMFWYIFSVLKVYVVLQLHVTRNVLISTLTGVFKHRFPFIWEALMWQNKCVILYKIHIAVDPIECKYSLSYFEVTVFSCQSFPFLFLIWIIFVIHVSLCAPEGLLRNITGTKTLSNSCLFNSSLTINQLFIKTGLS